MATDNQKRANRENAKSSTGPRTAEGKSTSSLNATTHGGYSTSDAAIPRGRFAEDPDEVERFVTAMVSRLEPRDELEFEEAHHIALLYLKFRRVDRFGAESIAGAAPNRTTMRDVAGDPLVADPEEARNEVSARRALDIMVTYTSRIESRSSNSLDRAYARYENLQKRELHDEGEAS